MATKRRLTSRQREKAKDLRLRAREPGAFSIPRGMSMEEELDEYSNIPLGRYQNVANRQLKEAYREGYQAGRNATQSIFNEKPPSRFRGEIAKRPDVGRLYQRNIGRGPKDMDAFRQGIRDVEERPSRLGSRHESRLRGRLR